MRSYDISADGQRFLVLLTRENDSDPESATPQLVLVQHWFDELARLAPVAR